MDSAPVHHRVTVIQSDLSDETEGRNLKKKPKLRTVLELQRIKPATNNEQDLFIHGTRISLILKHTYQV